MSAVLHVLSIGSEAECGPVRDALLERRKCRLSIAAGYGDLVSIAKDIALDVAILHSSLSPDDLRISSEYIRRRWPRAKILVICANTNALDDPLYDEWVRPGLSGTPLLMAIEHLVTGSGAPVWSRSEPKLETNKKVE